MRIQNMVLLSVCIIVPMVCADSVPTGDTGLILEELGKIRASLDRIADELSALRSEKETRAAEQCLADDDRFTRRGADIAKLTDIKLPSDADADAVKKYILDIVSASRGQNTFSGDDPQVALLTRVGQENLPLLIETLSYSASMDDFYIRQAIVDLADEDSKSLILDALPIHHNLVEAVIENGWEEDAAEILLTGLKNTGQYLPTEWITAVASLWRSESYPLLREYFINGRNRSWTYKAIRHLPIDDMSSAVAEAWRRSRYGDDCNRVYMAMIAARHGHLDALEVLADSLSANTPNKHWINREVWPAVLQSTSFRGPHSEFESWFKENRESLRFDQDAKKFIVVKATDPSDAPTAGGVQ